MTRENTDPVWHGDDLEAAKKRAKRIKGMVVKSIAPHATFGDHSATGFWSDDGTNMIRTWEKVEADYTE